MMRVSTVEEKTLIFLNVALFVSIISGDQLMMFGQAGLGLARNGWLLTLMTVKVLLVALFYMNLRREPLSLKISFFILIPVGLYFLLFMLYDAAYIWRS